MITSANTLTGVIAWIAMSVWVLMAVFKDRLQYPLQTWRLLHVSGFVVIATLGALMSRLLAAMVNTSSSSIWCGGLVRSHDGIGAANHLLKPPDDPLLAV